MLVIGRLLLFGNGPCCQLRHQRRLARLDLYRIALLFQTQPLPEQLADTKTDKAVGHPTALCQINDHDGVSRG